MSYNARIKGYLSTNTFHELEQNLLLMAIRSQFSEETSPKTIPSPHEEKTALLTISVASLVGEISAADCIIYRWIFSANTPPSKEQITSFERGSRIR